ncbi:von Willebrand factor type A domain protein [Teladorsagia circumcincta]|uniref:von Willebrand factor type A domain protein n=1 Tax=Teladorsagia circumcincta TaxID=45464 RepID=A0A2G9UPW7_TELCI|nr:von Willebrand factor type A domain protein [Teladorsagia circumcincta]
MTAVAAITSWSSPPPTEVRPMTAAVTSTPETTPTSLPVNISRNIGCSCVLENVWLDIFLLMDASVSMTSDGIASAIDYVVSAFTRLTVGQAERFQTRVGVIRYADSVELIADLNVYTSIEDLFDLDIPLMEENGTNIEGAIRMAISKFRSPSHRAAARSVVIIAGSTYKYGGYNDPTQIAKEFRDGGGTIITIEYGQEKEPSMPMIRALASPNFNLTNEKSDGTELRTDELRELLCEANCFCKKDWRQYKINQRDTPQGGCYHLFAVPSNQTSASQTCDQSDGMLVLDDDSKTNMFLMNLIPPKTKFWLGLRYKENKWTWPGGHSMTKDATTIINFNTIAYTRSGWFNDDCVKYQHYVCQTKPCDSTKYCEAE